MNRARIAIIGGTGFSNSLIDGVKIRIGTPYGPSSTITIGKIGKKDIVFLPIHGKGHMIPPHKINDIAS